MEDVETLKVQLADRDKRIAELRAELTEERKLITELLVRCGSWAG